MAGFLGLGKFGGGFSEIGSEGRKFGLFEVGVGEHVAGDGHVHGFFLVDFGEGGSFFNFFIHLNHL